jgi:hypothetical protein
MVSYVGEKSYSTDRAFKQFESLEAGYRAMFVLLHTYRLRGYGSTIEQMISRYAPPSENNTEAYITAVCDMTGIGADEPLDTRSKRDMIPLVGAMSKVENGVQPDFEDVEAGFNLTGW